MKKITLIALSGLLISGLSNAASKYDGFVNVGETFVYGTFLDKGLKPRISADAVLNTSRRYVGFNGTTEDKWFTCRVYEDSTLFQYALSVYRGLGNGSLLYVRSETQDVYDTTGPKIPGPCLSIVHTKSSSYLD